MKVLEILPTPATLADWKNRAVAGFTVESDGPAAQVQLELAATPELFSNAVLSAGQASTLQSTYYNSRIGWNGGSVMWPLIRGPSRINVMGQRVSLFGAAFEVDPAVWLFVSAWERIYFRATAWHSNDIDFRVPLLLSILPSRYLMAPFLQGNSSSVRSEYRKCYEPAKPANSKLPWLATEGNRVVERDAPPKTRKPVLLRGVNYPMNDRSYMDGPPGMTLELVQNATMRWWSAAAVTKGRLKMLAGWGVNVLRITLNQEWALKGWDPNIQWYDGAPPFPVLPASEYLADLDQVIAWASENGMYVILCLHTISMRAKKSSMGEKRSYRGSEETRPQPLNAYLPDNVSLLFWATLASRYSKTPAVLFDLLNEPHRKFEDTYYQNYYPEEIEASKIEVFAERWRIWVLRIVAVIRELHQRPLFIVAGMPLDGGCLTASLAFCPIYDDRQEALPDAVYKFHWYRWPSLIDTQGWTAALTVNKARSGPAGKLGLLLSDSYPIFAGEWGINTLDSMRLDPSQTMLTDPKDVQAQYIKAMDKQPIPKDPADWGKWADALIAFMAGMATKGPDGEWKGLAGFTGWSVLDPPAMIMVYREDLNNPGRLMPLRDCDPDTASERAASEKRLLRQPGYVALNCANAPELSESGQKTKTAVAIFNKLAGQL